MGSFSFGMWEFVAACRIFICGMGDLLVVVCGIFVVACRSLVTAYVIFELLHVRSLSCRMRNIFSCSL